MQDFIELGPTPHGEPCAQTGSDDYIRQQQLECIAFTKQLLRTFPPPEGAELRTKTHNHDFGTYREVRVIYDVTLEAASTYAYMLDESTPEFWDAESKDWLAQNGYRFPNN